MWSSSLKEIKTLPYSTKVLFVATLVNRMGTMVLPFMTLYLTRKIGLSVSTAGYILGAYGLIAIVVSLFNGWICQNIGIQRTLLLSLLLTAAVTLLFPLAQSLEMIVGLTVLLALANEPFRPVMMTLIGDLVSDGERRMAYTFLRFSINIGMSIGPALGGYLATRSFTWLFVIDGITSLLAGIFLWKNLPHLSVEKVEQINSDLSPKSNGLSVLLKDMPFVLFLISMIGIGMVYFQHESTQPLFMVNSLGLIESDVGLIFLTNTILIILFEIPLNLRIKAWSHLNSLTLGCLLMALGFGLTAFAHSLGFVLLTVAVWTFGEMISFAAAGSWVSERGVQKTQGLYMGYFSSAFGIAAMIGPWAGTQLLEKAGPRILWGACFLVGIFSSALLLAIRKPNQSVA